MMDKSTSNSYEEKFSNFFGTNIHTFSFWKGRVALYAILKALNIGSNDEVILPGYTCVVVPNAIRLLGAIPKYVDNVKNTYHIDPEKIEDSISKKTKAIIAQHTYGIPARIEDIIQIGKKHGIPIIEDCAHALGSKANGEFVGNYGLASFFSSQWSKPFTTGLGGLAITSNVEFAKKLQKIHDSMVQPPFSSRAKINLQYFIFKKFFNPKIYWQSQNLLHILSKTGFFVGSSSQQELDGSEPQDHTWKMSNDQKKAGFKNLTNIESNLSARENLVKTYDGFMEKNSLPKAYRTGKTNFLRYPLAVKNKVQLLELAQKERIELGSWFDTPLHPAPLDKHYIFGYHLGQCPNAEKNAKEVINLPLHQWVNESDIDEINEFIKKFAEFVN